MGYNRRKRGRLQEDNEGVFQGDEKVWGLPIWQERGSSVGILVDVGMWVWCTYNDISVKRKRISIVVIRV